jgi:hypothetical protein
VGESRQPAAGAAPSGRPALGRTRGGPESPSIVSATTDNGLVRWAIIDGMTRLSIPRPSRPARPARLPRLGVDIGRVIIDGAAHPDGGDTAFFQGDEATMLATPEVTDAVFSLAILTRAFAGRVWLVSKCGPRTQERTLRWLRAHDFYNRTGIDPDHVRFCRERAQKREHCEELDLTHFVDDRPDVHAAIHGVVDHQYLFGPQDGPLPEYTTHVLTWARARAGIEATLRHYAGATASGADAPGTKAEERKARR